jgi:hypothetical protein
MTTPATTVTVQDLTAEAVATSATAAQAEALWAWYGPLWASSVLFDAQVADEEYCPHPLSEPTFAVFCDDKADAFAAWLEIEKALLA